MSVHHVEFHFITGLRRTIFRNARLRGSWDANGRYADVWTETPMEQGIGEDGCPVFSASVALDLADRNRTFRWGVVLDGPQGSNFWGIPTEIQDVNSAARYCAFRLRDGSGSPQRERYHFTTLRRLGANKRFAGQGAGAGLHFAVWAPNANRVEVVFASPDSGYIDDQGNGIDPARPVVALTEQGGIWEGTLPGSFDDFRGRPYMYRILNAQNRTVFRSDIYSRNQIGRGKVNPARGTWSGSLDTLDGTVSCSQVIDPDLVRRGFQSTPTGVQPDFVSAEEFWASEFTQGRPVPSRLEDLVIYELHIGSLGFGKDRPGDLGDALEFLGHLVDLGINAVELLPMAEFSGTQSWGYGDTHHLCIESSAGGRDKYRHFIRECHRRGIAVLQDVVYNHYDNNADRAQWAYDSEAPEQNIYYWYEGKRSDHPASDGGYLDNGSSGFAPRYWEEPVRRQFIDSAAFLIEEMHVDGLRVDLTQAIHRDNRLHANGHSVASANVFGQKLLREWSRTLRMIRPGVILIAEDHTGWDAVTKIPAQGGLGFDATWDVGFYHSLIGDSEMAGSRPRLLKRAGFGGNEPLSMADFAGSLYASRYRHVVFHESHDEAGNAGGTARTTVVAVNHAPLVGATRSWAEARSRLCFGLSLLSAGTPMFFMGEEIGASKRYTYNQFLSHREDILSERSGDGEALFRFYRDLVSLRHRFRALRSQDIDILHQHDANRIIAFKRWSGEQQVMVFASLNNVPFNSGYVIVKDPLAIPDADWKEVFNSDAAVYGGRNVGNRGASLRSRAGRIEVVVPAAGFVVLVKQ